MELVINNKLIDAPIELILKTLKSEIRTGKLKQINPERDNNIAITCPVHKGGFESNPSCQIFCKKDDERVEYGTCHCFSCGWKGDLAALVSSCFNEPSHEFGQEWLIERFGTLYSSNSRFLPEIELNVKKKKPKYLDPGILKKYEYYNDYLLKRGISQNILNTFQVGYDPIGRCVTFPVWDEKNNLCLITKRSVISKSFYIDKEREKPIYLLNFILNWGLDTVYICESQINALTAWTWGYPAIGLIGTGSEEQYEILNKSPIRNYILCFDGDEAGDKGVIRFLKNIRKDVFITIKNIPRGKDLNDLTKEQFDRLTQK